jgi:fatty acid desaturase
MSMTVQPAKDEAQPDCLPNSDDCLYADVLAVARRVMRPETVNGLVEFRPGYVVFRTLALLAANVALWAAALTLSPWFLIAAFPLSVAIQQEMLIWVHEGAHRTLFRNRSLNDYWVSFWFASPLGMNFETYRRSHMSHHGRLAAADDGDRWTYELYIRGAAFHRVVLKAIFGFYGVSRALKKYITGQYDRMDPDNTYPPTITYLLFALFWNGAAFAACLVAGRWYVYFVLWIVPLFSVAILITILRTIAEHQPMDYEGRDPITPVIRTTLCSWLERRFLFPLNFNYHVEHHLFPQVPFFNLPRLHSELVQRQIFEQFPNALQRSALGRIARIRRGLEAAPQARPASA